MSGTPGLVSLSRVWASELEIAVQATCRAKGANSAMNEWRGSVIATMNVSRAVSYAAEGLIQLVLTLASRTAFTMYSRMRATRSGVAAWSLGSAGQMPSMVW